MPVSVVQLSVQLPQKMHVSCRRVIFLTGGSAWRTSVWVSASVGQTFTHAPQPMQVSRSNSGLPLYLSGTTQGTAGNRVVNRGEKTAVTASFNSLNFGKRNFELPLVIDYRLLIWHLVFFYRLSVSSAYLSTTLFFHSATPEA